MNHKDRIFILIMFISFWANAQVPDSLTKEKKYFTFFLSPDYSFRNLSSKDANNLVLVFRDSVESGKLGYTAGVYMSLYEKNALSIDAGIVYSDKGERAKEVALGNPVSQDVLPISSSYNNHYYYLGVPLKASYVILQKKRFSFFATAGLSFSYLLSNKTTTFLEYASKLPEKRMVTKKDNTAKLNIPLLVGLGIRQKLDGKAYLVLTPLFTYSVNSLMKNSPVRSHLFSCGLNVGLQFGF